MSQKFSVDLNPNGAPEILITLEPHPGPRYTWLKLSIYAWQAMIDRFVVPAGKTGIVLRLPLRQEALRALPDGEMKLSVEGEAKTLRVTQGFYSATDYSGYSAQDATSLFTRWPETDRWHQAKDWQILGITDATIGGGVSGNVSLYALMSGSAMAMGIYSLETVGVGVGISGKTKLPPFKMGKVRIRQKDFKSLFTAMNFPVSVGMPGDGESIRCLRRFSIDDLNGKVGSIASGSLGLGVAYSISWISATGLFLDHCSRGPSIGASAQISAGLGAWTRLFSTTFESDVDGGLPFGASSFVQGGPVLKSK